MWKYQQKEHKKYKGAVRKRVEMCCRYDTDYNIIIGHLTSSERHLFCCIFDESERKCFAILKEIIKWAELCKSVILLVSRILWHKGINPSLKEWRFWYLNGGFDTHRPLSGIIYPFQFTQCHSSEGCLFILEKTCDVEC